MKIRAGIRVDKADAPLADALLCERFLGWWSCDESSGLGFATPASEPTRFPRPTQDPSAMKRVLDEAPSDWVITSDVLPNPKNGEDCRTAVETKPGLWLYNFAATPTLSLARALLSALECASIDRLSWGQLLSRLRGDGGVAGRIG